MLATFSVLAIHVFQYPFIEGVKHPVTMSANSFKSDRLNYRDQVIIMIADSKMFSDKTFRKMLYCCNAAFTLQTIMLCSTSLYLYTLSNQPLW